MSRALMQQALEALVTAEAGLADIGDADREPTDDLAWCEERAAQALAKPRQAITALREALAQQEHPEQMARLGWQYVECPACGSEGARAFPKPEEPTIKQSLTVEQEPVELETIYEAIVHWDEGGGKRSRRELARRIVDLYASPPQRQPTEERNFCPRCGKRLASGFVEISIHTCTPPRDKK